jgi:apolipoprotein N-acyltransferase
MSNLIKQIRAISNKYYYLLTAFLLFLSFPSIDVIPLTAFPLFSWFCLIPLFVYIREKPLMQVYLSIFQTFLLAAFFSFGWMRAFGGDHAVGQVVVLLFLIPALATLFSGKVFIAELLSRKNEKFRFFIFPAVWVLFDFLQSVGYLAFPWTYLGYTQYSFLPLIQISSITGVFGVTFLILCVNTAFSIIVFSKVNRLSLKRSSIVVPAVISSVLLISSVIFGMIRLSLPENKTGKTMKVAIVQSCISPWEDWEKNKFNYLADLTRISDAALLHRPDFLIWSESATLEPMSFRIKHNIPSAFDEKVRDYARNHAVPLYSGEIGIVKTGRGIYQPQNNAILFNADGNIYDSYSKIHLAPFGEWFPYENIMPWVTELTLSMGGSIFIPGNSTPVFSVNGLTFGNLICYESMFFRLNREYARKGVDFLLNITNDGWSSSYSGHYQHFAASPFRAIETGRTYIRAGNTGLTTVIDPKGRYKAELPILSKGFIIADINTGVNVATVYSRIGDMFVYLIILLLCIVTVIPIIKRKIKK